MSARTPAVGVDLGGTKIYSLVATAEGEVLGEDRCLTQASEGPEAVIRRLAGSVRRAMAEAGAVDLVGIGIATPGPCDPRRGIVTLANNLPGWRDVPLARLAGEALGLPARIEHDAAAACYGEYLFGAGQGFQHIVYVTLGTGIGGGMIIDGRLYHGASGAAG